MNTLIMDRSYDKMDLKRQLDAAQHELLCMGRTVALEKEAASRELFMIRQELEDERRNTNRLRLDIRQMKKEWKDQKELYEMQIQTNFEDYGNLVKRNTHENDTKIRAVVRVMRAVLCYIENNSNTPKKRAISRQGRSRHRYNIHRGCAVADGASNEQVVPKQKEDEAFVMCGKDEDYDPACVGCERVFETAEELVGHMQECLMSNNMEQNST